MAHVESKYLYFSTLSPMPGRKTLTVEVRSRSSDFKLGIIHWFGRWRQYTFSPNDLTTFNKGCLREIADYCEQLNREHRMAATDAMSGGDTPIQFADRGIDHRPETCPRPDSCQWCFPGVAGRTEDRDGN